MKSKFVAGDLVKHLESGNIYRVLHYAVFALNKRQYYIYVGFSRRRKWKTEGSCIMESDWSEVSETGSTFSAASHPLSILNGVR